MTLKADPAERDRRDQIAVGGQWRGGRLADVLVLAFRHGEDQEGSEL